MEKVTLALAVILCGCGCGPTEVDISRCDTAEKRAEVRKEYLNCARAHYPLQCMITVVDIVCSGVYREAKP